MYLYIKQRVFSIGDKYDIYDSSEAPVFSVVGKVFSIGANISLYDMYGNELYQIRQKITFFLKSYEVYRNGILVATIKQELRFMNHALAIESSYGDFAIEGNYLSYDFEIYDSSRMIGSVHKKWLTFGDTYELYIDDSFDMAFFTAIVIAIDNCIHNEND